jgi:hypothetical protein
VSSVALGTGAKTFTTQAGLAYSAGARARAAFDASNYLEGPVASYSGTTLTITADRFVGSGTYAAWTLNVAGDEGDQGDTGPTGATGPQGNTILSGVVAPDNGEGVDGDFYLNTNLMEWYGPKTAGDWGSPISLYVVIDEWNDVWQGEEVTVEFPDHIDIEIEETIDMDEWEDFTDNTPTVTIV